MQWATPRSQAPPTPTHSQTHQAARETCSAHLLHQSHKQIGTRSTTAWHSTPSNPKPSRYYGMAQPAQRLESEKQGECTDYSKHGVSIAPRGCTPCFRGMLWMWVGWASLWQCALHWRPNQQLRMHLPHNLQMHPSLYNGFPGQPRHWHKWRVWLAQRSGPYEWRMGCHRSFFSTVETWWILSTRTPMLRDTSAVSTKLVDLQ